uniref:Zinc finger HIT-type containing 2 n=1 Tax=Sphenodon punctatus TaxID=8508 RepID=A0A8D0GY21_SPHPU
MEAAAGPCALCLTPGAPYTCPRCHLRFCSVPCYRGHGACARAFHQEQLRLRLQGQRGDPDSRRRLEAALLRLRELREPGDAETLLGLSPEEEEPGRLWERLSPAQRAAFERLLSSGEIGAFLPPWRPWWWGAAARRPGLIQELEGTESDRPPGGTKRPQGLPAAVPAAVPPVPAANPLIPAVPAAIPPLSSLIRSPVSPLLCFQLPNALYAYAFALTLYHGDVSDVELLPEFCDTVLGVSGALGARRVFSSTAEALQAAMQAVTAGRYPECPLGNAGAMMAVAQILMGESQAKQKGFSLAALSHIARLLGKAKKLVPAEERPRVYGAKKKCDFLLSWVNEHEMALTVLALEVQQEYKTHLEAVKEVAVVTEELEKMWGGKVPPAEEPLIQELD